MSDTIWCQSAWASVERPPKGNVVQFSNCIERSMSVLKNNTFPGHFGMWNCLRLSWITWWVDISRSQKSGCNIFLGYQPPSQDTKSSSTCLVTQEICIVGERYHRIQVMVDEIKTQNIPVVPTPWLNYLRHSKQKTITTLKWFCAKFKNVKEESALDNHRPARGIFHRIQRITCQVRNHSNPWHGFWAIPDFLYNDWCLPSERYLEEVSEITSLKEVEAELLVSFLVWGFLQRRWRQRRQFDRRWFQRKWFHRWRASKHSLDHGP